jgi:hypothetical protein
MAESRLTRLAVSDDTRERLTALLSEASLFLDSVVFGLEALARRLPPPSGVEAIGFVASQAAEAMAQFEAAFHEVLDQKKGDDA